MVLKTRVEDKGQSLQRGRPMGSVTIFSRPHKTPKLLLRKEQPTPSTTGCRRRSQTHLKSELIVQLLKISQCKVR